MKQYYFNQTEKIGFVFMIPQQKKLLQAFLIAIGTTWLAILALDWVRLFLYHPGGQVQEYALSKIIKFIYNGFPFNP